MYKAKVNVLKLKLQLLLPELLLTWKKITTQTRPKVDIFPKKLIKSGTSGMPIFHKKKKKFEVI